jgi:hypothetical protein
LFPGVAFRSGDDSPDADDAGDIQVVLKRKMAPGELIMAPGGTAKLQQAYGF